MLDKNFLLGVGVTSDSKEKVLEYILKSLQKSGEKYYIVTPNPEILVYADKHPEFKEVLNQARLGLPDGIGVILAGKLLGKSFKEKITGTDLVENLCKRVNEKPITVGFLGGGPKIAEKVAECLRGKYPGLRVVFVGSEWPKNFNSASKQKIEDRRVKIENEKIHLPTSNLKDPFSILYHPPSSIDLLFVAFGFPKQEEWMAKNLPNIPVKVAIGVGGAFDYISGKVPRAPKLVQRLGFEWLYRLIRQPWRAKRQLALFEFVFLILKEKLGLSKPLL